MADPTRRLLLRRAADALTPGAARRLDRMLAQRPDLRERAEEAAGALDELLRSPTRAVGLRTRDPRLGVSRAPSTRLPGREAATLGVIERGAGASRLLEIGLPEGDAETRVVLLRWEEDAWQVRFPADEGEEVRLGDLPIGAPSTSPTGEALPASRVLTLTPGAERWAIVILPPDGPAPDWGAEPEDRWGAVIAALRLGALEMFEVG